jgi:hypothetical protein
MEKKNEGNRQQGDPICSLTKIMGNIHRDEQKVIQTHIDGYKDSLHLFFQKKENRLKNKSIVLYNIAYTGCLINEETSQHR